MTARERYFKPSYLEKTPTWPSKCAKCELNFVDKAKARCGKYDYKVTSKNHVWLCKNSKEVRHSCVHGYCDTCFKAVVGMPV